MLRTEAELRTLYIKHMIGLYTLEMEDGFDLGDYPTYEDFLVMYKEELELSYS